MAKILVTGGAGYVGSHCCFAFAQAGHKPVVYDNLSSGRRAFARWGPLEIGDIRDADRLAEVMHRHRPDAVIHCAGLIEVGRSVVDPAPFYDQNVTGSLRLLEVMRAQGVDVFVLSSTCAIFGPPRTRLLAEDHPTQPLNPYGASKLMIEQASRDYAAAYGGRFAHLRYFNAAGAEPGESIGEWHDPETHALPLAIQAALGLRGSFSVFGTDYDTADGTCIRDYVHVADLARAHVAAAERLLAGGDSLAVNLGTGVGISVRELTRTVEEAVGCRLTLRLEGRRPGDAPMLVADNRMAERLLGWRPTRPFLDTVQSAVTWHRDIQPKVDGT